MSIASQSANTKPAANGKPTNVGRTKYGSHVFEKNGDKNCPWLFLIDPSTRQAFCAKWPPRNRSAGADGVPRGSFGCRRPYGNGPGFCNGETQKTCIKPKTCHCSDDNASSLVLCHCPTTDFAAAMAREWDAYTKKTIALRSIGLR